MLTDTCAVCGSVDATTTINRAVDYITKTPFGVRQCSTCGLARTEPQPLSMDRYYPKAYRQYSGITLRMLKLLYGWRVRHWIRRFPRGGRALEVGCGDGWMLGVLRERGWRVYGNERSIEGARGARAANQISMFVGDLDALRPASPFNLIILFQVLEHLADPLTTLQQSANLLDDAGMVVVAVPNLGSWQARLFGRFWFHLDVPRHLCHHTPKSLSNAFERAGLRIVRTRFVSFEQDPYGWVQSSLNRLGFNQNLLTKWLMGMDTEAVSPLTLAAMFVVAGLLVVPSVVVALCSWAAGSGAIIEVWGAKA